MRNKFILVLCRINDLSFDERGKPKRRFTDVSKEDMRVVGVNKEDAELDGGGCFTVATSKGDSRKTKKT